MIPPPPSQPENPGLRTLKAIVFALAGVVFLAVAVYSTVSTRNFVARARRAAGEVVRLNAGGAHPQVRFVTDEGQVVEYSQDGMIGGYRTGDRVTVLYDPHDPKMAPTVDTTGALWGFTSMDFLMGAVFVLVAYGISRPDPVTSSSSAVPPPIPPPGPG